MKKLLSLLLSVCMFVSLSLTINADETQEVPQDGEPETYEEVYQEGTEVEEPTKEVEEVPETQEEVSQEGEPETYQEVYKEDTEVE